MRIWIVASVWALVLVGCSDSPRSATVEPGRLDTDRVARGAVVYQQNCATCHGSHGEGVFNWQRQQPDGKWLPPPLDASGHAWHHPWASLKQTIHDGTQWAGGGMPAWGGKLSDKETEDVIFWFQSTWPAEIFRAWIEVDRRSGG